MNPALLKVLVERNILGVRTEIDARYRGRDIAGHSLVMASGTFLILSVHPTETDYQFVAADVIDGSRRTIPGTAITGIDGMDPARLAANYDLDPYGIPVKVGKRRGRKPRMKMSSESYA
ncbi:MAG: hypothetical protein EOO77_14220 [Oxalobacteraceae bacterium]|nr:MAG: hypothetical protein EOO77_14220 [Oxalobacteraceae bacterium]